MNGSRRDFLKTTSTFVSGSLVFLSCGELSEVTPTTTITVENGKAKVLLQDFEQLKTIGQSAYFKISGINDSLVAIRVSENQIRVLSRICTHAGCKVKHESSLLDCPCHGSRFDLNGNVIKGPADAPLASYMVEFNSTDDFFNVIVS